MGRKDKAVRFLRMVCTTMFLPVMAVSCAHLSYTSLLRQRASDALNDAVKNGADMYNKSEYEYAEKLYNDGVQRQRGNEVDEANTLFKLSTQLADEIAKIAQQNRGVVASEKEIAFNAAREIHKDSKIVVINARPVPAPPPAAIPAKAAPVEQAMGKAPALQKAGTQPVVASAKPAPVPAPPPAAIPAKAAPVEQAMGKAPALQKAGTQPVVASAQPAPVPAPPPAAIPAKATPVEQAMGKAPAGLQSSMYSVVRGDSLWRIAGKRRIYNDPLLWSFIYSVNRKRIKNPDLIYPGQRLMIPRGHYKEKELMDTLRHYSKGELIDIILRHYDKRELMDILRC
ncbi:MAG: LysM peptidoglycan-binding domain-containing protein, partial [Deltaproteobacteria bacterium]|nr:LysM peptidoglycan-binding domain-containing protein [Deltaproteobacteria bacterium]